MQTNARLAFQLLVAFVIVIAGGLFLPLFGTTAKRGIQTKNLSNAMQLATGCKLYALDHEGRFPMHLNELEPDYIPDVKSMGCAGIGQGEKPICTMDWLYFGAGFDESNPPKVLIASPQATTIGRERKRVAIQADTSGFVIKEDRYQEMLAETIRQMRALDDAQHPAKAAPADAPPKGAPQK